MAVKTVILDTNLWSYIGDEEARPDLDALLTAEGWALQLAPSVLLEVLRTPKPEVRQRIVHAMTTGRPARQLQSEAESQAEEIIREVRRARPDWLRRPPDTRESDRFHRLWTHAIWEEVKVDLDGFVTRSAVLPLRDWDDVIVSNQRDLRRKMLESKLDWTALDAWADPAEDNPAWYLEGWPAGRRVEMWRVSSRDVYWEGLARAPLRRLLQYEDTTYADFVGARVALSKMVRSRADFTAFWFDEVERTAVRRSWLRWAVDHAQSLTKVTGGNPRDAQHAAYLCDCDLFLTADVRYAGTLELVRRAAGFALAQVVVVGRERDQPTVEAIRTALRDVKS